MNPAELWEGRARGGTCKQLQVSWVFFFFRSTGDSAGMEEGDPRGAAAATDSKLDGVQEVRTGAATRREDLLFPPLSALPHVLNVSFLSIISVQGPRPSNPQVQTPAIYSKLHDGRLINQSTHIIMHFVKITTLLQHKLPIPLQNTQNLCALNTSQSLPLGCKITRVFLVSS